MKRTPLICAVVVSLVSVAAITGCTGVAPASTVCAGTGVHDSTAAVSIDIGDLTTSEITARLHVGDELFIGSNGCGDYAIPPKDSVAPVLLELSRHKQAGPGPRDGSHALEVRYRAMAPGQIVVPISCRSNACSGIPASGSPVRLTVSVRGTS
jgi:hypothetical protein